VPRILDLSDLPAVDGHCHPLLPDHLSIDRETLLTLFSESRPGTMPDHIPSTLFFRRALRDLAARGGAEASVEAVLASRRRHGSEAASQVVAEHRVAALLVDTGYPPEAMSLGQMRGALPCAIHEVFRIETCAQGLLANALPYPEFLEAFRRELRDAARNAVALKSIIAYRSGLAIEPWDAGAAARAYRGAVARMESGGGTRLTDMALLDTLFLIALDVCQERDRPIQLHSGFGDPDVDLLRANPLLLRPLLEDPRWASVQFAALHMSYPYFREAAFMASVWPNFHVDLSLALPFLGPAAVFPLVEMLSLAPSTKLLYGSDLRGIPEILGIAAGWARASLGEALGWLVDRGGLTVEEARVIGARVLAGNAVELYKLSAP
jgi:uncharacterized protein